MSPRPRFTACTKLWCAASPMKLRRRQHLGQVRVVAQVLLRVADARTSARRGRPRSVLGRPSSGRCRSSRRRPRPPRRALSSRQPGLRGDGERLGDGRGHASSPEVVDELQHVAVAGRADVEDVLAERREHRLSAPRSRRRRRRPCVLSRPSSASFGVRASGASMKRRRPCAAKSARMRAVEAGSAVEVSITIEARRAPRPSRPSVAVDDLLDLRRAGDAENHDVGCLRASSRGVFDLVRAGGEQVLQVARGCGCALKREREALGQQVLRHAVAHHAEADESDAVASCGAPVVKSRVRRMPARASHQSAISRCVARGDLRRRRRRRRARRRTRPRRRRRRSSGRPRSPCTSGCARGDAKASRELVLAGFQAQQQHAAAMRVVCGDHRRRSRCQAAASAGGGSFHQSGRMPARVDLRQRARERGVVARHLARRDHFEQQLVAGGDGRRAPARRALASCCVAQRGIVVGVMRHAGTWRRARRASCATSSATSSPASNASGREPGTSTGRAIHAAVAGELRQRRPRRSGSSTITPAHGRRRAGVALRGGVAALRGVGHQLLEGARCARRRRRAARGQLFELRCGGRTPAPRAPASAACAWWRGAGARAARPRAAARVGEPCARKCCSSSQLGIAGAQPWRETTSAPQALA